MWSLGAQTSVWSHFKEKLWSEKSLKIETKKKKKKKLIEEKTYKSYRKFIEV